MSEDAAPTLRFQRTEPGVWVWTRRGDPVAGTSHTNPRIAVEEGLALLRTLWSQGEVSDQETRAIVEEARRALRDAPDSDAAQAADRFAGRFLWTVQRT